MVAKAPDYQETMGSDMVAFYDVSMMNEHYNCKGSTLSKTTLVICYVLCIARWVVGPANTLKLFLFVFSVDSSSNYSEKVYLFLKV